MSKKLRLLLFENCNRKCEGCCNKDFDLSKLEVEDDFSQYDEIFLTGGEPMLDPELVMDTIFKIRYQTYTTKIILYTAKTTNPMPLIWLMPYLDGITLTLHTKRDVGHFEVFNRLLDKYCDTRHQSLRLNVFKGVDIRRVNTLGWQVKKDIVWIKDCPLPKDEVLKRLG